ncbi:MAG: tetratricopeptide repeat protein [Dehalococcoidia bacterium]
MTLAQLRQRPTRPFTEIKNEAVEHALAGRWQQAADLNAEAIQIAPEDVESHNRLAKALIELGRYNEARSAAETALRLRPDNNIARRHMERLSQLTSSSVVKKSGTERAPRKVQFIADRARATVTELERTAPPNVLAAVSPGDSLTLEPQGSRMAVLTEEGEYLGTLEVHIAQRLRKLIDGGNRYDVTAAKISTQEMGILVSETYRSPAQANIVSFPPSLQKSTVDFDLDDERPELLDDGSAGSGHEDEEETPVSAPNEQLRAILNGEIGEGVAVDDDDMEM